MSVGIIALIAIILFLISALPRWLYSMTWGYYPRTGLCVIFLNIVVLLATGRI